MTTDDKFESRDRASAEASGAESLMLLVVVAGGRERGIVWWEGKSLSCRVVVVGLGQERERGWGGKFRMWEERSEVGKKVMWICSVRLHRGGCDAVGVVWMGCEGVVVVEVKGVVVENASIGSEGHYMLL